MWRIILATALSLPSVACADSGGPTFDSSDPVHCMVIFGIAVNGAKQVSNIAMADQMVHRASFLAEQQGGAEWIREVTARSLEIGAAMEAANDERATINLLNGCISKQDADPAFRSRLRKR